MTGSEDRAAELARLRAENEALKATLEAEEPSSGRVRTFFVGLFIVLGCLSAAAAALGIWARTTALNTDSYLDTVASLPQNPEVAAALAQNVVDEVFADLNLEQELEQLLPEGISFLAAPVGNEVRDVAIGVTEGIISSDAFQTIWVNVNRLAHTAAVKVLTGRGDAALTEDGDVVLDLSETVAAVREQLTEAGLGDLLPPPREEGATATLFDDTNLGVLQFTVDLLDAAYWGLPVLTALFLAAALWISRDRRRTWVSIGLGLAIAMAASLLLLDLSRGAVVDGIEDPVNKAGVTALWDQLLSNLTGLQAALLVLSLIIALAAFLAGPSRGAVSFRSAVRDRVAGWRSADRFAGAQGDSLGTFLTDHLSAVRLAGVVGALLFMFLWPRLTVGIVAVAVIALILYLLAVELLRAPRRHQEPATIDLTGTPSEELDEEAPPVKQLD